MVNTQGLKLSTKGLQNVPTPGIDDLALRLGDQAVSYSRIGASFLSPRLTAALLNDPTINEYELEIEDSGGFDLTFLSVVVSL
jgi:hypothetical protein